ncbi:MAG TPA: FAD-dependent monooxygenase [Burkholderiales bacterium]|nr:FAD-dependent monooxygenase [Burkholderiales bacterium]
MAAVEPPQVDVAIAGGGPVGCALALALSGSDLSVARIADEADVPDRPIALSYGSRLILERLAVWSGVASTAIHTIHVSQQGFGRTVIRCADYRLPALGYVTSYSGLVGPLAASTPAISGAVKSWEHSGDGIALRLSAGGSEARLRARLLVLADGGSNRDPGRVTDYRQRAIVAEVAAERAAAGTAWERFTAEGPLALLPFGERYALVWSTSPATAAELQGLRDAEFLARLRQAFGGRLGDFRSTGPRSAFPLSLRRSAAQASPRVLAIGNAAQTLHPVAGQGLNLGLRDAWELARMLLDAPREEVGAPAFVARYSRGRGLDRRAGIGFTDFLVRMFSNSVPPLALARGAGLALLDVVPPARHFLARRMIFGARALP